MPSFIFFPQKEISFDGKQLESKRGEGIVLYINNILGFFFFSFFLFLGTQVDPRGGFNEQFGRNPELDRLARLFIANVFY